MIAAVGGGAYVYDTQFNASAVVRSLRTAKAGYVPGHHLICIAIEADMIYIFRLLSTLDCQFSLG